MHILETLSSNKRYYNNKIVLTNLSTVNIFLFSFFFPFLFLIILLFFFSPKIFFLLQKVVDIWKKHLDG